jgi:hypothetical protein
MARDTKRTVASANGTTGHDQVRDTAVTGSAVKGYDEFHCDGSSYDLYGNRVEYAKLTKTTFK